ncbi:hypothetical protein [Hyphomonas sp.]|uniref:hypothetical protein n=1 Tax=Hyphomonas sp. TaxID=87 RepID=UPI000C9912B2|nr:hypothetical protein [Hyphomonas sp.]MAL43773.1 hypothetical protein [Hyphomonas sp.]
MNRKQYILEKVKEQNQIDKIQQYLDYFGLIPGVGDVVDIGSAVVDLAQGQPMDAAFRGAAALPIVGPLIGGSKALQRGIKTVGFASPFVAGAVSGREANPSLETGTKTPDTGNLEQDIKKYQKDQQKQIKSRETTPSDVATFASMYNTRMVDPRPLAVFREELDRTTDMLVEVTLRGVGKKVGEKISGAFKKKKSTDDKKIDVQRSSPESKSPDQEPVVNVRVIEDPPDAPKSRGLQRFIPISTANVKKALGLGVPGAALTLAALSVPAIPSLLGSVYGKGGDDAGAAPLVPQPTTAAGDGGMGAVGTVFDRLTQTYGYIPGFNPAGAAMGALGRRVGAIT